MNSFYGASIYGITSTKDGGFAYYEPYATSCSIDSSFTKFNINVNQVTDKKCNCIAKPGFSNLNGAFYTPGRTFLFKVDSKGKIQWVKSLFNEEYKFDTNFKGTITETKDLGFIISVSGRICKTDSTGNILWKLYFDRDSIPYIKKTDFLYKAIITDIYECKDGSYIALLQMGCSLLKISKEGKPLWLRSLMYKDFANSGRINTNNVFETDDGGYMAIGLQQLVKNDSAHIAHFLPHTNVIKTDKNGKVIWKKTFGTYKCSSSNNRSTLLKLANGKWLINIIDCDSIGTEYDGKIKYSGPVSKIFIINNDGNIIKQRNGLNIDPYYGAALAADSGFYFFNQDEVMRADKNLNYQWTRVFGGRAVDIGVHGVTADGGVLCEEEGTIYKFDKYGHSPSDSVTMEVSVEKLPIRYYLKPKNQSFNEPKKYKIEELKDSVYYENFVHFKINATCKDVGILRVEPYDFETNKEWKEGVLAYSLSIDGSNESFTLEQKKKEFKASGKKYKDARDYPFYMNTAAFKPGIYNSAIDANTLDILDNKQLNGLFIIPKNYIPYPEAFEITNFYGYRDIYSQFLCSGKYTYKLIDRKTGEIKCSGNFEFKIK